MTSLASKTKPGYSQPLKETPATARDLANVQSALSQLLAEETALMDTMQIQKISELQERKLKLTGLLERYTRYLSRHPEALAQITPQEKAELKAITDNFYKTMRINYNTLLVARAVNGTIVKCVTQNAAKKDTNPIYNARGAGAANGAYARPVSVTLNQTI